VVRPELSGTVARPLEASRGKMNDRYGSCYESLQNPAYRSTLAHLLVFHPRAAIPSSIAGYRLFGFQRFLIPTRSLILVSPHRKIPSGTLCAV
jgi:hypothetical protein